MAQPKSRSLNISLLHSRALKTQPVSVRPGYWRKETGEFFFRSATGDHLIGKGVAILFNEKTGHVLHHGEPMGVLRMRKQMGDSNDLVYFENRLWSPDFLDKLIRSCRDLLSWWNRQVATKRALSTEGFARC